MINTQGLRWIDDGKRPRRASIAKRVYPHGRRYPGGKPARRLERGRRDRYTRKLELHFAKAKARRQIMKVNAIAD